MNSPPVEGEFLQRIAQHRAEIAALDRHILDLRGAVALKAGKVTPVSPFEELTVVLGTIQAMAFILKSMEEKIVFIELQYGSLAETIQEQEVHISRGLTEMMVLVRRFRTLERAVRALMVLESDI